MSEARDDEHEDLTTAALEGQDAGGSDDAPKSDEERALALGWTPKERFKGDPERWVDAATFVKRGEELMPILQANNRRMEKALETERKERARLEKTLKDFSDHHSKTAQREYERAQRDIQARLDAATSIGDIQGVRDATQEIVDLAAEARTAPQAPPAASPEFEAWQADNPWFGKDKPLTAATVEIANEVAAEGYTGKAQIKEVDRRVRETFPSKFTNPNRERAAAVEGATSAARKTGKSYSDLPADAKAACDEFVKRVPGFTRESYVKDYFA